MSMWHAEAAGSVLWVISLSWMCYCRHVV